MCGIAGVIGSKKEEAGNKKTIEEMVSCIMHRGPDQDGFFIDENVGLGMRRLSIIDLSTGKQPITSEDESSMIFFNGEIYNYLELRNELENDGYKFKTHSDTETILAGYLKWGKDILPKLRGMFAFCIYNKNTGKIFLARDFFGIKPLYYLKKAEKISAFGSEVKSFLKIEGFRPEVNDSAVYNYLSYQYNPLNETFFKNVYKLPPAHCMEIDTSSGEAKIEKYWSLEFNRENLENNAEQSKKEVREVIEDSVKHHMIADVPVGSFLSGGVDSSIIATLMQKVRGEKKIKTFTVGFEGLTEGKESKETSDFLGTDHTEILVSSKEYFDVLPKAVWHFDEPVADPSAIGLYFVAREARKHVTVVLSGEGADELFGGYNIYLAPFAYRKIAWIPKVILKTIVQVLPEVWGKNYIKRASDNLENWYIGNASIFKQSEVKKLWQPESNKPVDIKKFNISDLYKNVENKNDSVKMQYIDINTWLVGNILAKADKMTMANSLELRVPFLDKEVASLAVKLSDDLKWREGKTKWILREAFKSVIPEGTRNRKKLGFPTPIRNWLTEERREYLNKNILENKYIKSHFNLAEINKLINEHLSKEKDNSRKIYLLLMLALWYNVYIEQTT